MANYKELQTRIALKWDTYANWADESKADQGANLVLLQGEIGLCAIGDTAENGSAQATTNPTVLFKVGDGVTPFKTLKWASALAADVHSWAKKSESEFKTWLSDTANFATDAEVDNIRKALDARLIAIENSIGSGGQVANDIAGIKNRLDGAENAIETLTGADDVDGSVAKALKDAKAYTDEREVEINKYADQAEADAVNTAKGYTDTEVGKVDSKITNHASAANPHNITAATVGLDNVENKSVATIKNEFTGAVADGNEGFTTGDAVYDAIEAAKTAAANTAQEKVNALANDQVEKNRQAAATNTAAISAMDTAYKAADKGLSDRIDTVEGKLADVSNVMDFVGAKEAKPTDVENYQDGDVIVITGGDDKGKEFVLSDGAWVEFGYADSNAAAISDLQTRMGTAESDIDTAQADIANLETAVGQKLASSDFDTWKQGHEQDHANKQTVINTAISEAVAAEKELREAADKAINDKIGTLPSDYATLVAGIANARQAGTEASAAVTALTNGQVKTNKEAIEALQDIVVGDNSNDKLRDDITDLQTLTGDASKGNEKLRSDLTTLMNTVNDSATGLEKTKEIADGAASKAEANAGAIADIKADYLKQADFFVIECGSSVLREGEYTV